MEQHVATAGKAGPARELMRLGNPVVPLDVAIPVMSYGRELRPEKSAISCS